MFDMKLKAGENVGYKLVIHYNKKQNIYHLSGHTVFLENRIIGFVKDQDGASLPFNTLEAVLNHIRDYPEAK